MNFVRDSTPYSVDPPYAADILSENTRPHETIRVVTDSSGAPIARVAVEAASPELIAGARKATTDNNGQYRVTDLRPRTYSVTFSVAGFSTLRRTGITLTASSPSASMQLCRWARLSRN